MGTCKTALPWYGGTTLLTYQLQQWLSIGFTPIVVLGSHNSHRQKDCPANTIVTINPVAQTGKTSSILTGLQHIPANFQVLAISAVDQPRSHEIYQPLLQAYINHSPLLTAPTYHNKLGHPILFSPQLLTDLLNIQETTLGLRQIIQNFYSHIHKVELNTPTVLLDINTPQTYHLNYP